MNNRIFSQLFALVMSITTIMIIAHPQTAYSAYIAPNNIGVGIKMAHVERYILEDGDGDPAFMHIKHELMRAEKNWFHDIIQDQPAELFIIVSSNHYGSYIALSSRINMSIEEQIERNGFASVVVNLIQNPTETFGANPESDSVPIGMTILRSH